MNAQVTPTSSVGWWSDHGTKILGSVTTLLGAAMVSLPTLQPIMKPTAYLLTQFVLGLAVSALGAGTVKRGFTNSSNST